MPTYPGQAAVGGPERERLHRHDFVGVDVPLVDFPGAERQRRLMEELLQSSASFMLSAPDTIGAGETLTVKATVENIFAGHALPSGVAAERQMWIAMTVRDQNGSVLFETGQLDANGDLMDQHSTLDPDGDPHLAIYRQTLYGEDGKEVLFFFQAKRVENDMIPLFSSRTANYDMPLPAAAAGELTLEAKLRFRSLPPYFLRELGLDELVAKVPIVDMEQAQRKVIIK